MLDHNFETRGYPRLAPRRLTDSTAASAVGSLFQQPNVLSRQETVGSIHTQPSWSP